MALLVCRPVDVSSGGLIPQTGLGYTPAGLERLRRGVDSDDGATVRNIFSKGVKWIRKR